jgi:hypothetical protein
MKTPSVLVAGAAFIALAFSFSAHAAFTDHGTYSSDDSTGLDWLKLTGSAGQTYDNAETLNPGWRYAVESEVDDLFATLFLDSGYVDGTTAGEQNAHWSRQSTKTGTWPQFLAVVNWENIMGRTTEAAPGDFYSFGLYLRENDPVLRAMGTRNLNANSSRLADNWVYSDEYTLNASIFNGTAGYGTFLVRTSEVPIPAAAWLFGSALLGLGVFKRRKA